MNVKLEGLPKVFSDIFDFALSIFATDIYLREGAVPFFKVVGNSGTAAKLGTLYSVDFPSSLKSKLELGDIMDFMEMLQLTKGTLEREVDTSFALYSNGRFKGRYRLNIAQADGNKVLSMRRLYSYVPSFEEDLRLPSVLGETKEWSSGLVIVTGPTGSGKSTTLASIMRYLAEDTSKSRVIITIEKPIEYVFENKSAFFIQREVGKDTESFVTGVHNALRQHPDVIYVGESRTPEEISATLMASETGHLTFTTLHTASAWGAISRIIDVFPADEQPQIRTILADQLRLVVAQRLVNTVDYAVKAVTEILYVDDLVRQRIRDNDIKSIRDYMARGEHCSLLNKELIKLVEEGVITLETAIKVSYDVKGLKAMR